MTNLLAAFYCLLLSVFFNTESTFHGIYLSLTEVNIDKGVAHLKMKVFADDLQDALQNHRNVAYKRADPKVFFSFNKELANNYFQEHFQIWTEGNPLELQLEKYSIEGDAYFLSFNCPIPPNCKSMTFKADFFMELFPTQINVVKLKYNSKMQHLKFDKPAEAQTLSF